MTREEIQKLREDVLFTIKNKPDVILNPPQPEQILSLIEQLEKAEGVIKFYADESQWLDTTHSTTYDGIGCHDFSLLRAYHTGFIQIGGRRAREYLKERGE